MGSVFQSGQFGSDNGAQGRNFEKQNEARILWRLCHHLWCDKNMPSRSQKNKFPLRDFRRGTQTQKLWLFDSPILKNVEVAQSASAHRNSSSKRHRWAVGASQFSNACSISVERRFRGVVWLHKLWVRSRYQDGHGQKAPQDFEALPPQEGQGRPRRQVTRQDWDQCGSSPLVGLTRPLRWFSHSSWRILQHCWQCGKLKYENSNEELSQHPDATTKSLQPPISFWRCWAPRLWWIWRAHCRSLWKTHSGRLIG